MDELTLLRELDQDSTVLTDGAKSDDRDARALLRASDALAAAIDREEAGRRPQHHVRRGSRFRRAVWGTTVTVCAVAAATGLFFGDVIGVAGLRPGATAEAAEVLQRSAIEAIRTADPQVGPDQYLRVTTIEVQTDRQGRFRWAERSRHALYLRGGHESGWQYVTWPQTPTDFADAASERAALRQHRADLAARGSTLPRLSHADPSQPDFNSGLEEIRALPADPRMALNAIYRTHLGQGPTPDEEAFYTVGDMLRTAQVPAATRATLYRAAALIPGVHITDRATTLDGRTGVAIGRSYPNGTTRDELIIDSTTGTFIGEETVMTRASGGYPVGAITYSASITTDVVDSGPNFPIIPLGASG
ncbi:CU044_5270 family protein [uncultured Amnibacterium sp.]|uniref:CU044_5270 family protein n=1 Tax=uncultured Amnibacterium sp. TaxID=1631851 RepID=UPI0035CC88F9